MIAVDTNLLVYAHRADSPWHKPTAAAIQALAQSPSAWTIPWPCLHEFLGIVTHPGIYLPPTPLVKALAQVRAWLESPGLDPLSENAGYADRLSEVLRASKVVGPRVHDARVAALCLHHGVSELWTADRDFSRFRDLKTRNPLVKSA